MRTGFSSKNYKTVYGTGVSHITVEISKKPERSGISCVAVGWGEC